MRKRKYLVGALLSVVGALVVSSTASAAVTSQAYTVTTSPAKQQKKVFGPVGSFKNVVDTNYAPGPFTPFGTQTVLTFSKDIKFTPGNIPQCNLSTISTVPQATSDAQCGASKVGTGSATINGGQLTGVVAAYNGTPSGGNPTIGLHTDVFVNGTYSFSTTLTGVLNTSANTLTVAIPPTGTAITHFETTITKKKSGKKTYYVMARCKKKKWVNSETTTFNDGTSQSATSIQKCKQKPSKKKK
jgi:hypothetical protein